MLSLSRSCCWHVQRRTRPTTWERPTPTKWLVQIPFRPHQSMTSATRSLRNCFNPLNRNTNEKKENKVQNKVKHGFSVAFLQGYSNNWLQINREVATIRNKIAANVHGPNIYAESKNGNLLLKNRTYVRFEYVKNSNLWFEICTWAVI